MCDICPQEDYHWREYFGTIPSDAFVAGEDIDYKPVYIGQGYYRNHGLKPGRLTPGVKEMTVPWGYHNQISTTNKVLCGPQGNFSWVKASAKDLHIQISGLHPVIGGHDDGLGPLYIGRINSSGSMKIGKIVTWSPENATMFYVDGDAEKSVNTYEVLVSKQSCGKIDAR